MWTKFLLLGLGAASSVFAASKTKTEIKVAAAADLQYALPVIVKNYEAENPGHKVLTTFGASGKLLTQIKEGAPFDIFYSADTDNATAVVVAGKAQSLAFPYAHGHLVAWVKNSLALKPDAELKFLANSGIKKIAIANPLHAPYGKLAEAALKNAQIYDQVSPRLVLGENVSQAAQFASTGAADVGLIARSQAEAPEMQKDGHFVAVDEKLAPPILQSGVMLKTEASKEAMRFQQYFMSPKSQKVMSDFGLSPVGTDAASH